MFFRALTVVSVGTTDVMTMRELGQTVDAFFGNDDDTAAVAPASILTRSTNMIEGPEYRDINKKTAVQQRGEQGGC